MQHTSSHRLYIYQHLHLQHSIHLRQRYLDMNLPYCYQKVPRQHYYQQQHTYWFLCYIQCMQYMCLKFPLYCYRWSHHWNKVALWWLLDRIQANRYQLSTRCQYTSFKKDIIIKSLNIIKRFPILAIIDSIKNIITWQLAVSASAVGATPVEVTIHFGVVLVDVQAAFSAAPQ